MCFALPPLSSQPNHFPTVHFFGLLRVMLRAFVGVEMFSLCAFCDFLV